MINNMVISGPANSGKSTLMAQMLETVNSELKVVVVTDAKNKANIYPQRFVHIYPEPFNSRARIKDKVMAIREALKLKPDILVVDQVQETKEATVVYEIMQGSTKVWFTVHGNDFFCSDNFDISQWISVFKVYLEMSSEISVDEHEILSNLDLIVRLRSRQSGEEPVYDIFSRGTISKSTAQGIVFKPIKNAV